jgi:hypothetical protein
MSNQSYASAVRSATLVGDDNKKIAGNHGCIVMLNVSAAPGVDTVTLSIEGKDPVSGTYYTVLAAAARVATGMDVLQVQPGGAVTANVSANASLPDTYRIKVTHSAGTAFTYSVSVTELL